MYCSNCGTKNPDGAMFCINCGASLQPSSAGNNENQQQYAPSAPVLTLDPARDELEKKATSCMILGIIACVLAWYPVTSIAAIVLGAISTSTYKKVMELLPQYGMTRSGKLVAGRICGLIGLIGGIVMTVVYFLNLGLFGFAFSEIIDDMTIHLY